MAYLDATIDTVAQVLAAHDSPVDATEAWENLNNARIRDHVNPIEDAEDRAREMDAAIEDQLIERGVLPVGTQKRF